MSGKGTNDNRRFINVTGKELHDLAEETVEAIVAANDPPVVFSRGDLLARVVEGEDDVYVDPYDTSTFKERLSRVASWVRTKSQTARNQQSSVPVRPDSDVISFLLNKKEYGELPTLDRVVTAPVLAPDGTVVTSPGYHPATKTLYRPTADLAKLRVPANVTTRQIAKAMRLVDELIGTDDLPGFPFAKKSDRAHAIGLLLAPFLRELIAGPTPLHLIEAPTAGTGKGLAADVLTYPGVGKGTLTPDAGSSDEWRKVITTLLAKAPGLIRFDNITGVLGGAALEAALTAYVWEDRILGVSRMMRAKVRNLWVATSNNAKLTTDMPRRCVRIRLDAGVERPSDRPAESFAHPQLLAWVHAHRADLVWAALVLCRAWVQAGMPQGQTTLGSYEDWAHVVGGVLEVIGVPGFLEDRDELYLSANSEAGEMADFLAAWYGYVGNRPVKAREIAEQAQYRDEIWEHVPSVLTPYRYSDKLAQQVGYLLRRHKDGVFGELKLEAASGGGGHVVRWTVRPETGGER